MKNRILFASQVFELVEKDWKKVSVKEIAARFQRDPSDISRLFRKATGKTIKEFVNEKRRNHLLEVIKSSTNCRGYRISEQLGFHEERSFYRWVKKKFGVSFTELCETSCTCRGGELSQRQNERDKFRTVFANAAVQFQTPRTATLK